MHMHSCRPCATCTTATGPTYVRWGRSDCPVHANLVYSGFAGASHGGDTGGGYNMQCLHDSPLVNEFDVDENPKTALLVRGQKTSGLINSILIDLFMLKKPHGALLRVEHAATLVPRRGTHPTDCLRRRGRRAPEAAQRGASI